MNTLTIEREHLAAALNYIKHVGSNCTMRGEAHPQQHIVDWLEAALRSEAQREALIPVVGECGGNWCVWLNGSLPYIWAFGGKHAEQQAHQLAEGIRRHLASPPPQPAPEVAELVKNLLLRARSLYRSDEDQSSDPIIQRDVALLRQAAAALSARRVSEEAMRAFIGKEISGWLYDDSAQIGPKRIIIGNNFDMLKDRIVMGVLRLAGGEHG